MTWVNHDCTATATSRITFKPRAYQLELLETAKSKNVGGGRGTQCSDPTCLMHTWVDLGFAGHRLLGHRRGQDIYRCLAAQAPTHCRVYNARLLCTSRVSCTTGAPGVPGR